MNTAYESAKKIALGLEEEPSIETGDDLWNISFGDSLGGGFGLTTEMPFQLFEKGFEPPAELVMQRSALMLYTDEYSADKESAGANLHKLILALNENDPTRVRSLLAAAPPDEWLSLVFLEQEPLQTVFADALKNADEKCRAAFADAAGKSVSRLSRFSELLRALIELC